MLREQAFARRILTHRKDNHDVSYISTADAWPRQYVGLGWLVFNEPSQAYLLTAAGESILQEFAPRAVGRPPVPPEVRAERDALEARLRAERATAQEEAARRREALATEARERRARIREAERADRAARAVYDAYAKGKAIHGDAWASSVIARLHTCPVCTECGGAPMGGV